MNRRQLAFVILLNALISLVVALAVVWVVELRRPDPEVLAAIYTPVAAPVAATFTPTPAVAAVAEAPPPADSTQATPAPQTQATTGEETIYVIQVGDSLSSVADRFGLSIAALVEANDLDNPDFVFVGQRLLIPNGAGEIAATASPTPLPAAAPGRLRISTVSSTGDLATESIAVNNDSDLAVNLQGWRLEQEGGPAYTFGNVLLFPGSGIQVFTGAGTDNSVAVYWNQAAPLWQPGSVARLLDPQGAEVARLPVP
jgi:LysM repeat protein